MSLILFNLVEMKQSYTSIQVPPNHVSTVTRSMASIIEYKLCLQDTPEDVKLSARQESSWRYSQSCLKLRCISPMVSGLISNSLFDMQIDRLPSCYSPSQGLSGLVPAAFLSEFG